MSLHTALRKHAESELDAVLSDLFHSDTGTAAKALVVYIHGRGHEPKKSFESSILGSKNRVIEKIEQQGVLVLGVDWDSAPSFRHPVCDRPIDNALAAGPLFARVVKGLLDHRDAHPDSWRDRKVVLLAHSMGGFVLRDAMENQGAVENIRKLFDIRVISESDVPAEGHARWLPVQPAKTTFVLSNPADRTLAQSMECDAKNKRETGPRLGTLAASSPSPGMPDATYIQLAAGDRHRIFTKGGANGNPYVCGVVHDLLNGNAPQLQPKWLAAGKLNTYAVPLKKEPGNECFKGELADIDSDD
ncbi:MAG: hypothetical protein ABIO49_13960 [Dokdonella sp.]